MQTRRKTHSKTKRAFEWGISSATIDFIPADALRAARDGSSGDCSKITPLEKPLPVARPKKRIEP